jgi:tRNA pseudouridine55 synthase
MARRRNRRERPGPPGFLVVDKPVGVTSHDVVDQARRWLGTRRIGHLGTLDPQATGVLPLAVRGATRLISFVRDTDKGYVGTVELGVETDTLDAEGRVVARYEGALPDRMRVEAALEAFRGEIEQIPPMFSAVKKDGVPLHKLARRGEVVEREPKSVRIDRLELLGFEAATFELRVDCSAGTYVRTLASDLGRVLGCGAHLKGLRRVRSGPFDFADAATVDQLEQEAAAGKLEERLVPPDRALGLPTLKVSEEGERRILHGADIASGTVLRIAPGDRIVAFDTQDRLLAILELRPDRRLWPLRVLQSDQA